MPPSARPSGAGRWFLKFVALDTAHEFGSLYQSGRYRIRHNTERDPLGFGIVCARAYLDGRQIGQWTGKAALQSAQDYCAQHEKLVPELDFIPASEGGGR